MFLCMMSMPRKRLTTLKTGEMSFYHRWTQLLFCFARICKSARICFASVLQGSAISKLHAIHHNGNMQANPTDREHFPFVLLGNKVDQEGGRTRVVSGNRQGYIFAIDQLVCW